MDTVILAGKTKTDYIIQESTNGRQKKISIDRAKYLIRNNKLKIEGYRLSADNRLIKDKTGKGNTVQRPYEVFTGEKLKKLVKSVSHLKHRYIVEKIVTYCRQEENPDRVFGISGIRGTGKTVAMCHAMQMLDSYYCTAYITFSREADAEVLLKLLDEYSYCQYIFIDEITRIRDVATSCAVMGDVYTKMDKRIVITGTNSYALCGMLDKSLFHRMILHKVTNIFYQEQKYLTGCTVEEYLKYGGILDKNCSDLGDGSVDAYISTAIVDNIVQSVLKNGAYSDFNTDTKVVRSIVFHIFYSIILDKTVGATISLQKFGLDIDMEDLYSGLGISSCFSMHDLRSVMNVLRRMGIIERMSDDFCNNEYVIVTPSLYYRLYHKLLSIYNIKETETQIYQTMLGVYKGNVQRF